MRLETAEQRPVRSEQQGLYEDDGARSNLLTPARRAALDALEREFRDLLQASPR